VFAGALHHFPFVLTTVRGELTEDEVKRIRAFYEATRSIAA